ncbi:MAG: CaiB/BaiF CoA-transferase family protein [Chloroflexi bacterium]|nr:CaiB/BaiF CoA-transferase family protein [Chloroflexota bacterium]
MQALQGIKIIDLSRNAPGPYCGMLLGDMGADVLRIEEPSIPTEGRRAAMARRSTVSPEEQKRALAFNAAARNKRSLALNLRDARGKEIFYQLADQADVILEGFRPGVVKRLGVDYDTISARNPRIVYASITGYGQYGPHSQLAGHDINYIAQGGAVALIGNGPDERPALPLNLLADFAGGGAQAALGIVTALLARERTGRGQYIDIAMSDGVTQLLAFTLSPFFQTGNPLPRGRGRQAGGFVHYNVYQCKDGKWMSVGSSEPYFFENFCRLIGKEHWIPQQLAGWETQEIMIAEAREIFKTRTRDEWMEYLNSVDLCAMRVLEPEELADDPHVQAREMVLELQHPEIGPVKQVGFGIKFSETPSQFRSFAPALGQHTTDVLSELGFAPDKISELRSEGVVS